jgi:hypothetical protein
VSQTVGATKRFAFWKGSRPPDPAPEDPPPGIDSGDEPLPMSCGGQARALPTGDAGDEELVAITG